eukprot:scaffold17869_cov104-Isochrysis_galbana.AAC.4
MAKAYVSSSTPTCGGRPGREQRPSHASDEPQQGALGAAGQQLRKDVLWLAREPVFKVEHREAPGGRDGPRLTNRYHHGCIRRQRAAVTAAVGLEGRAEGVVLGRGWRAGPGREAGELGHGQRLRGVGIGRG